MLAWVPGESAASLACGYEDAGPRSDLADTVKAEQPPTPLHYDFHYDMAKLLIANLDIEAAVGEGGLSNAFGLFRDREGSSDLQAHGHLRHPEGMPGSSLWLDIVPAQFANSIRTFLRHVSSACLQQNHSVANRWLIVLVLSVEVVPLS